ncbi:amidohydrolase [Niallia sp. XMNu-256]|uniref:amidohydrolase n=1 Tax=Niallia sp. XMNu-256 TaxID=3082444 RepID=UPI0030CB4C63
MRKIYINGNIYTFNLQKPHVQSVVIENGRFVDMGETDEIILQWNRPSTVVIDLEGFTVTPGLIDSHLHLSMIADQSMNLNLTGVTSKQEMLDRIKERAAQLQPNQWLIGGGWDEHLFTNGSIPTLTELDHVAPANPLLISRICQHAAIVNSKALEYSHYQPNILLPEGGSVVLDETTNQPTGLFLDTAINLIKQHIPDHPYESWKNAMRNTIMYAMERGLTSVHSNDPLYLGGLEQTWKIYDELLNKEQLGLRTNLLINHEFFDELRELGMYTGYGNDTLQIGAVKIFADGAFGKRTALLSEPYSDKPNHFGEAMYSQEQLYEIIKKARNLDMPVAVHTIGDQALKNILDLLDRFPPVSYRDRLIHTQVVNDYLIKRLINRSRTVDIQPRFVASDFPWVEKRLGKKRIQYSYNWRTLIEAGVQCAGGSDSPIEPIDPILGIHAAVTRKKPGEIHQGYQPNQKLSMVQAFQLFTEFAAYPTNEEDQKGTIARGKLADMTVFSADPFQMKDADELLPMKIVMTIIGGEIKYRRNV